MMLYLTIIILNMYQLNNSFATKYKCWSFVAYESFFPLILSYAVFLFIHISKVDKNSQQECMNTNLSLLYEYYEEELVMEIPVSCCGDIIKGTVWGQHHFQHNSEALSADE